MGIAEQIGIRPYTGQTAKEVKEVKALQKKMAAASVSGTDQLGKPLAREVDRQLVALEKRLTIVEERLRLIVKLIEDQGPLTLAASPASPDDADERHPTSPKRQQADAAVSDMDERKRLQHAARQKRYKMRRKPQKPAGSEL